MRILIAGSDGFIGRNVYRALKESNNTIVGLSRPGLGEDYGIDLGDYSQVESAIKKIQPEVIVNCAGVVSVEADLDANKNISVNLLTAAIVAGAGLRRFIMCGSAGEYGLVDPKDYPIKESQPLVADQPYPLSKIAEEVAIKEIGDNKNIDVIIARIFNPIGPNMAPRFLISGVLRQIDEIRSGKSNSIEVGRLDALRDYIDITDVASAIGRLATVGDHVHREYNIGSGAATTNKQLIELMLKYSGINKRIILKETSAYPEKPIASQADITRMKDDFGWTPKISLDETIKGVMNHYEEKS
ncbi:MAG: NAD(P)-dependent oxidoreductase [Candidatus Saccharimonadales bacterium]